LLQSLLSNENKHEMERETEEKEVPCLKVSSACCKHKHECAGYLYDPYIPTCPEGETGLRAGAPGEVRVPGRRCGPT
jgi:hypothetical protein